MSFSAHREGLSRVLNAAPCQRGHSGLYRPGARRSVEEPARIADAVTAAIAPCRSAAGAFAALGVIIASGRVAQPTRDR